MASRPDPEDPDSKGKVATAAARVAGCRHARVTGLHLAAQTGDAAAVAALLARRDVDVNALVEVQAHTSTDAHALFARPIDFAACCIDASAGAAVLKLLLGDARIHSDTLGDAYAMALTANSIPAKSVLRSDPRCKIGSSAVAAFFSY
jgi:hypothetical protein